MGEREKCADMAFNQHCRPAAAKVLTQEKREWNWMEGVFTADKAFVLCLGKKVT